MDGDETAGASDEDGFVSIHEYPLVMMAGLYKRLMELKNRPLTGRV
jgi:hypothetical protein